MKSKFRNIGHVSESWLNEIGIFTIQDLEKLGPEKAFELIKKNHKPTINLLYSLIGAVHDEDWRVIADIYKRKNS
ncbi:MAG: TfoX/Sxy family protein [Nitrosopumilus sp.]|nr:TfoX/Sxy family protein [Nitrosopumilus sp.]